MIRDHLKNIELEIERLKRACGRGGENVRLVLVTKNVPPDRIREAYEAGHLDFGENRVKELLEKKPQFPDDVRWHFVGHLQTNKVKDVVGKAVLIHSVDSVHLAKELEKVSGKSNQMTEVLLEVNTSGEASKFGFKIDELEDSVAELTRFSHLRIKGLMTVGPLTKDESKIRASFRLLRTVQEKLKALYPDLDWQELSMGMSDDYPIAIQEGATLLRIGRAVFGERVEK